jgi:hypothetical protein
VGGLVAGAEDERRRREKPLAPGPVRVAHLRASAPRPALEDLEAGGGVVLLPEAIVPASGLRRSPVHHVEAVLDGAG